MKTGIKLYYTLLITFIVVQAVSTVYQLGGTIGHGEKITNLQQEYSVKKYELSLLQEEKYKSHSLTALAIIEDDSYHPIGKPITLIESSNLASR
ncbi:MAG: hypothetical protein HN981_04890 [Candidatus Pacebacteria bacterium]|jgi:hypothetical protein|nr:hypothetical protein [Candidatus Paceibacterota bacterium]MBT4652085.1 hypothetical protein [Candidatus Paceibacterota bacterium]MBT6756107.1 hypothetical protein [Candidatus Paceibacterota bacterium]MBT6921700.1 hypothetical protein [Candidatus Paceibacterota bacterium]